MKKILTLFVIMLSINVYGTQYVPMPTENAEWQVIHTSYPYQFQLQKFSTRLVYKLHGDTIINNITYKKICYKDNLSGAIYGYLGAIREQDKKLYYVGNGYYTSSSSYYAIAAKIKAVKDCYWSYNFGSEETLLYDFSAKPGATVQWGYRYMQVTSEDSVLVGNSYRRCLHLGSDIIIEGIGSVTSDLISAVTPIPMCSDYYNRWDFDAFLINGRVIYKSPNQPTPGYQTVYSNRKAYYQTNNNNTETLKIDSCILFNDSVFYPSRTMQLISNNCYDPQGGGLAGKKIVFNNNWNYFFNRDNDSIKIKTDALLNESWTMFRRSNMTITATVTKWDTTTVLGVKDSIKTITLHFFDSVMKPLTHDLEDATIVLSKHYGLTKTLNFTYFPALEYDPMYTQNKTLELIGITNPELGVQNIKWFDVYDFQVGDEFHYIESSNYLMSGGSAYEKKSIIRILKREDLKDTIRYTEDIQYVSKSKQNLQSDYIITSKHYQDTNLIQKNTSFDQERGLPVVDDDSTRLTIYPMFNNSSIPQSYYKHNGCWIRSVIYDDACNFVSYAKGRGLVSSNSGCFDYTDYSNEDQVYYKKGSVSWGIPLVLTDNEELTAGQAIHIYPNPVTDNLHIDGIDGQLSFELYDAQGRLLMQQELNATKSTVSLLNFSKGMYLYQIKSNGKQVKIGKIVKN